jgi:hypothetical protein
MNRYEAEGWLIFLAIGCISTGIGELFGAGYGWLSLGLAFALIAVLGACTEARKRK